MSNPSQDQYQPTHQQVTPPPGGGDEIPFTGMDAGIGLVLAVIFVGLGLAMRRLAKTDG